MSKEIDERVVEMRFDNEHFEKNVQTSMSTLDKFKQKLQFKNAGKSFEDIDRAAKKTDLSPLAKSADRVGLRFNAMYTIADQAFRNITNSAMIAGKRIVSALTIDPIKTGFQEYETQINSVQTILANTESKGSTLQDVNAALAQLNTYADKTIYNFTEMTRNIGTFTAAGVDLDTSVSAIKGIANLAAVSGSTSQQASTAMYQLSQALSSGTVKLMDWNSVVNAGMGGQVFQDSLKETARVHGVAIDQMIKEQGSFRETLSEGWLTAEILTETLSKFTGDLSEEQLKSMGYTEKQIEGIMKLGKTANDAATKVKTFTQLFDTLKEAAQSGWTKSWELLVGDFGEAKDLLTDISDFMGDIIGKSGDKRNAMLMGGLSSGWKQLLNEGIHDAGRFESTVSAVAKQHGVDIASMVDDENTFQDVLKKSLKEGTLTSDVLSESISKFTEKVSGMSAKEMEAAGYTAEQIKKLKELDEGVKNGSISMERFTELIIRPSGRELLIESLWNSIKALTSVIKPVKQAFEEFFPALNGDQLYTIIEVIRDFTASLTLTDTQSKNLKRTFRGIFAVLDIGVQIVKAVAGGFVDLVRYIAPAGNGILSFTGSIGDFLVKLNDTIKSSNIFTRVIKGIGNILKPIGDVVKSFASSVAESFNAIANETEERLGPLTRLGMLLKSIFGGLAAALSKLAPAAGKLAGSVGGSFSNMMSAISESIQNADYTKIFDVINGGIFSAIGIFIAKFVKSTGDVVDNFGEIFEGLGDIINSFSMTIKVEALKRIASALLILSAALLVLSLIDSEKLTSSLAAITVLFGELIGTLSIFTKISDGKQYKNISKITHAMITLSTALLILTVAMKIMGTMSLNEILIGIAGTIVGMGTLIAAVNLLPEGKVNKSAKAVKKLAMSLIILAVAMKIMGSMSWKEMGVGLITTFVGMSILVGAVNLLPKDAKSRIAGVLGLTTSLVILGAALKIISSIGMEDLGVGLHGVAIGLGLLVAAVHLLPKDTVVKTLGIMGLATSLIVLGAALKIMGSMSWDEIKQGLGALAGSLGLIVLAMISTKKALPGAAALLVVAAALAMLTPVLLGLGSMSWNEIIRGLGALAGAFIVIGVAALVLKPLIGTIISLSVAMALFGVGVVAVGAGVVLFAAGITALAAALTVGGGAIVVFVSSLISLIPFVIEQIGIGLIALCNVIAGSADAICKAFTVIVVAIVEALKTSIPALVEGLLELVMSLLEALTTYLPQIVPMLINLFGTIMDVVVANMSGILDPVFKFLIALIEGIASRIGGLIEPVVNLFAVIFQALANAIGPIISNVVAPILTVLKDLLVGLFEVLAPYIPDLCLLFETLATIVSDAIVKIVTITAPYIPEITKIVSIISDAVTSIIDAIVDLVQEISPILESIGTIIGNTGKAIKDALGGISDVIDSVGGLIKTYFDGISGVIDSIGNAALNAGEGFKKLADGIKTITKLNLTDMVASLAAVAAGLGDIAEHASGLSKAGTGMKKIADSTKTAATKFDVIEKSIERLSKSLEILTPTFKTAISTCVEEIRSFRSNFETAGKYLIQGLALGITNNESIVTEAARNAAVSAYEATKDELGINSPSLVFKEGVGRWICEGIAEGIEEDTSVEDALKIKMANLYAAYEDMRASWNKDTPIPTLTSIAGSMGLVTRTMEDEAKKQGKTTEEYLTELFSGYYIEFGSGAEEEAKKAADDVVTTHKTMVDSLKSEIDKNESEYDLQNTFTFDSEKKKQLARDYHNYQIFAKQKLIDEYKAMKAEYEKLDSQFANEKIAELNNEILALTEEISEHEETLNDVDAEIAKETAKKIGDEFQKTTDRIKKDLEMLDLAYANLELETADSSQAVRHANSVDHLNKELALLQENEENSRKKLNEIRKLSKSDSEEYQAAYKEWLEAKSARIAKNDEISETQEKHLQDLEDADDRVRESEYALWKARYQDASEQEVLARELQYLNSSLKDIEEESAKLYEEYIKIVEKEGKDSIAAKNALADYNENLEEENKIRNQIKDNKQTGLDLAEEARDSVRESEYNLWVAENQDVSVREKLNRELTYVNESIDDALEDVEKAEKAYNDSLKSLSADATEQNRLLAELNKKKEEVAKLQNQKNDVQKNILSLADEERSIAYETARIEYDIWEKTAGRDAKDEEKELKQLEYLNKQLAIQNEFTNQAMNEYARAISEYGSNSLEASRSYKAYLNELKSLSELKKEILDLEESAADRQKRLKDKQDLAQTEYEDYIKRYEKYYRKNGMSRADLERDAKLVSGYDPGKVVNNITDKTKAALESVTTSVAYQSLLTGFSDMGQSYVKAVNEGVTSQTDLVKESTTNMVTECVAEMLKKRPLWIEAGKYLVEGLVKGIKDERSYAINSVMRIVKDMIEAAKTELDIHSPSEAFAEIGRYSILGLVKGLVDNSGLSDDAAAHIGDSAIESLKNSIRQISDVVNSDLDTHPTIRPVLDLSNIRSGTARLNAMVSNAQAIAISDSRKARERYDENQNGNEPSTNKGNTYQFTQNNYSPKALSRTEIYRQTKNQFAAMKEVLT